VTENPDYDVYAQAVIDNMDKQIAPMVWYALKTKKYDEVAKMMTQRQQLIDRMNAKRAENEGKGQNKSSGRKGKRRTRKRI
jgi:hypothetical protein